MKRMISLIMVIMLISSICPLAFAKELAQIGTNENVLSYVQVIDADLRPNIGQRPEDNLDISYTVGGSGEWSLTLNVWRDAQTLQSDFKRFEEGHKYFREWKITPAQGCRFAENTIVIIHGDAYLVDEHYVAENGDFCFTSVPFGAVEGTPLTVKDIMIKNADVTPIVGAKSDDCLKYELDEKSRL